MLKKFFITWVTYNSRYSERMKLFKVEKSEGYFLDFDDRILIYDLIYTKVENQGIKNFTLNVLSDHVHLVIMYDDEKLSKFVGEIKGGVSFEYLRNKKISEIGNGKGNRLWAKGFSKTFLNTDEYYEKAIEYTFNNSEKHGIESIYRQINRML